MHDINRETESLFPALTLLVKHGGMLAPLLALGCIFVALYYFLNGAPLDVLVLGIGASPLVYLLVKSYVELVRVMADMLLPK